jgi:hypothetical protein
LYRWKRSIGGRPLIGDRNLLLLALLLLLFLLLLIFEQLLQFLFFSNLGRSEIKLKGCFGGSNVFCLKEGLG